MSHHLKKDFASFLNDEHYSILLLFFTNLGLACIMLGTPYLLATQKSNINKFSLSESGFDLHQNSKNKFDV